MRAAESSETRNSSSTQIRAQRQVLVTTTEKPRLIWRKMKKPGNVYRLRRRGAVISGKNKNGKREIKTVFGFSISDHDQSVCAVKSTTK